MTASPEHRNTLIPLLATQLRLAGALDELLQAEHRALLSSDLATLAGIVAQKRAAAESLEQASQELHRHTAGAPHRVIPALGDDAAESWATLGALADQLRHQNLNNGALLNERQNRLRWVAERASQGTPALYAPRNNAGLGPGIAASLGGRSLARA